MTLYTDDPVRDADNYNDQLTRLGDACDAEAAFILRTPVELQYVVENQQAEIWQYLVDIVEAVGKVERHQPYAESTLLQAAKGLRDMLAACAAHEVETYPPEEE